MKEVAAGAYRKTGSLRNPTKSADIVTQKMTIMLIVVRPQFLPRRDRDDERTNSRQRPKHRSDKVRWLLNVLYHVEQQNCGYPFAQVRVQIGKIGLSENKASDVFMNARVAEIAAISIEPRGPQDADIVTPAGSDFQNRVTFPANGTDMMFDDVGAGAMPIVKLIPRGIGFVVFVAAELGPNSVGNIH